MANVSFVMLIARSANRSNRKTNTIQTKTHTHTQTFEQWDAPGMPSLRNRIVSLPHEDLRRDSEPQMQCDLEDSCTRLLGLDRQRDGIQSLHVRPKE